MKRAEPVQCFEISRERTNQVNLEYNKKVNELLKSANKLKSASICKLTPKEKLALYKQKKAEKLEKQANDQAKSEFTVPN